MTVSKLRKILDNFAPNAKVFVIAAGINEISPGTYNVKAEDAMHSEDDVLILEAKFKTKKTKKTTK